MKKIIDNMERLFAAGALAEEGVPEYSNDFLRQTGRSKFIEKTWGFFKHVEKSFEAAAYAEADCPDMALQVFSRKKREKSLTVFLDKVGLGNARFSYGIVYA